MAPRPSWRGYLRLSLVSCPVRLYPAVSARERVSFHLLNPDTHNRIQMRPTDPETGKEVPRSELVKGYEFQKGQYIIVEKDELDALKIESSETIDIERFVDIDEIEPIYYDSPYYLAPEGELADETFRVVQQAMKNRKVAGLARLVLSTHEHGVALMPHGKGMLLNTLRPAEEIRDAEEYFEEIGTGSVDKEMVQLAERIIEQKEGEFDPEVFTEDHYQSALKDLIEQKIKGEKPVVPKVAPRPSNVVNLMDALKRSLGETAKPPAPSKKRAGAGKRAAAEVEAPSKAARSGGRKRRSS
jgi:DNA end-binding protein Ku